MKHCTALCTPVGSDAGQRDALTASRRFPIHETPRAALIEPAKWRPGAIEFEQHISFFLKIEFGAHRHKKCRLADDAVTTDISSRILEALRKAQVTGSNRTKLRWGSQDLQEGKVPCM